MEDNIKDNIDSVLPSMTSWSIKPLLSLNGAGEAMGWSTLPQLLQQQCCKTTEPSLKFTFIADRK